MPTSTSTLRRPSTTTVFAYCYHTWVAGHLDGAAERIAVEVNSDDGYWRFEVDSFCNNKSPAGCASETGF